MRASQSLDVPAMNPTTRCVLILTLLAAGGVHAADKPKEGSFGKGKPYGAYLTRDQLRSCLKQQVQLSQQDGDILKEQTALKEAKADIARRAEVLKELAAALDRTSQEAVTGYNAQVQERDRVIEDYQSRVAPFNARVDTTAAEHEAFSKACDNRRYFEEDEIAIKKGR